MRLHVMTGTLLLTLSVAVMAESAEKSPKQSSKKPNGKAAATQAKPVEKKDIDPATGMEFVNVKGGCFQMGDVFGDGEAIEKPVHEVCVADFSIGKYEVTQGQWQKVMGDNPAFRKECGAECPLENISWNKIQEFVSKLNSAGTAKYRLPTEAEWEYAARSGGKKDKWSGTSDEKALQDFAWLDKNSDSTTHKTGQKKSNSLGLHDMSGNILEWCQDYYDEAYYGTSPKDNPTGPAAGEKRVLRGGAFGREAKDVRTTSRSGDDPAIADGDYGFRLVRTTK